MDVRTKDTYRIDRSFGISESMIVSLVTLYQPLIGKDAVNLYLTLASEAVNPHTQETHSRLFALMNSDPDSFDRACAKLEEYMLVRVYKKTMESRNSYIYVLHFPMSAKGFLSTPFFMNRYVNIMGQKQAETTISRLKSREIPTTGYQDITRKVSYSRRDEVKSEVQFSDVKPRYRFAVDDTTIVFDYDSFIRNTSVLVFPAELRTQETMSLIGRLATVYGISADHMRVLVKDCVNLETMEFNSEKLKLMAERSKPDITSAKDPYSLPPVSFLMAKQKGAAVSMTDRRILEHLSLDMHFSSEVINVMIEYILRISDNRLNSRFVDMVAGEWARDGITTKDQAVLETKKQTNRRKNGRVQVKVPEFIEKQEEGIYPENQEADQAMIEEIRRMQSEMKE